MSDYAIDRERTAVGTSAEAERMAALEDQFSVFRCHDIQNCTQVCPKGLNPMKAISDIRRRLLKEGT